jgi:hypothetical protein
LHNYAGLTLRNIVRFLNDTPFILPQVADHDQTGKWLASQQIIHNPTLNVDLIIRTDCAGNRTLVAFM